MLSGMKLSQILVAAKRMKDAVDTLFGQSAVAPKPRFEINIEEKSEDSDSSRVAIIKGKDLSLEDLQKFKSKFLTTEDQSLSFIHNDPDDPIADEQLDDIAPAKTQPHGLEEMAPRDAKDYPADGLSNDAGDSPEAKPDPEDAT